MSRSNLHLYLLQFCKYCLLLKLDVSEILINMLNHSVAHIFFVNVPYNSLIKFYLGFDYANDFSIRFLLRIPYQSFHDLIAILDHRQVFFHVFVSSINRIDHCDQNKHTSTFSQEIDYKFPLGDLSTDKYLTIHSFRLEINLYEFFLFIKIEHV